jgi:uncharacterized membrane protein YhaH (DUF805 family)
MKALKFLRKYGLNTITIFAIFLLGFLAFTEMGRQFSVNLEQTNPAAFYWGFGSFFLATFGTWVAVQVKRWKK